MSAHWFVIKHVPDLVRREPRNIGVILFTEGSPEGMTRVLGEQPGGDIDGRTVPQLGNHLVYKAWVRHWRGLTAQGPAALGREAASGRTAGSSFYIEEGGQDLVVEEAAGQSADDRLDDLFTTLVRRDPDPAAADDVQAMSQRLIARLGIKRRVTEKAMLSITTDGAPDDLWFDYRYDNGRAHLMQRVGLAQSDKNTWDRLHMIETTFDRLQRSGALPGFSAIAFVKQRNADSRLVEAVHGRLGGVAEIVDVSDQDHAAAQLGGLLHITSS